MAIRDTGTEQLIKDTARRVFFAEGKLGASTQEIADAAGLTRTIINYYFRSKDILFEQVYMEGMEAFGNKIDAILGAEMPFRLKIEKFIDGFISEFSQYPYQELYFINEINTKGMLDKHHKEGSQLMLKNFLKEIQQAMDDGIIKKMRPINFIMTMNALVSYPMLVRPLFMHIFEVNAQQYERALHDRKKIIMDLLFEG